MCPPAGVTHALEVLEVITLGIMAAYDGRAWLDEWALDVWSLGSYLAMLPGQVTTLTGVLGRREGNILFAGEDTATESRGFLDGAVESGERAAREALQSLGR